jgi:hypothetical protein
MTTSDNLNSKTKTGEHQPRADWRANRRRNRALGLDRFGRPLPRVAGRNPRALGTNPKATRPGVKWFE